MAEELKLVERFEELRAGMIVVIENCIQCGQRMRALLLRYKNGLSLRSYPEETNGWEIVPRCPKEPAHSWLTPIAIQQKRVYRILDGLESPHTTTQETEKPKERVR